MKKNQFSGNPDTRNYITWWILTYELHRKSTPTRSVFLTPLLLNQSVEHFICENVNDWLSLGLKYRFIWSYFSLLYQHAWKTAFLAIDTMIFPLKNMGLKKETSRSPVDKVLNLMFVAILLSPATRILGLSAEKNLRLPKVLFCLCMHDPLNFEACLINKFFDLLNPRKIK